MWARPLRMGARTPKPRREAPEEQAEATAAKRHEGTIVTERPNEIWGMDAMVAFTWQEAQVTIFAMADHCAEALAKGKRRALD